MPDADGRAAGGRVGRRHERIGAVVDVEQRALRALEQHPLAGVERLAEQQPGVGDAVLEPLGVRDVLLDHLVDVDRLAVVDLDQDLVLLPQRPSSFCRRIAGSSRSCTRMPMRATLSP